MPAEIKLLSTDFDGTLVARTGGPVLDRQCMERIRELQMAGAVWVINTGRSVDLLESGLTDFAVPFRPDFILTSERDVFRPSRNGGAWEAFGDWNERCARDHRELFSAASSVLAEVVDFRVPLHAVAASKGGVHAREGVVGRWGLGGGRRHVDAGGWKGEKAETERS